MKNVRVNVLCAVLSSGLMFSGCGQEDEIIGDLSVVSASEISDPDIMDNNVVYEWTNLLLELERYSQGRPNASARALAYIYLASYETLVPGMDGYISNAQRLRGLRVDDDNEPENIHWEIALNACMAGVTDHFLLNISDDQRESITIKFDEIEAELANSVEEAIAMESREWGSYIASQVIAYSQTDVAAEQQIIDPQPVSYEPPVGEGFWTYSADPERALFPYWGETARTFVISPKRTSTIPPIEYSEHPSSEYFDEMMEVYQANNRARAEDDDELWIAEFWSDDVEGLMFSPPARQLSIANQLVEQFGLSLQETVVLYMKLGFSLNDAAVAAWKYKYDYMVMRPNVFIHEYIDVDFQTNLYRLVYWPNPSFPSYPSGHSTFASAAAGVFIDFFGNEVDFTDWSHEDRSEFKGAPRTFATFEEMAEENAFSRIPLGVHMRMDCAEGLRLGYEISDAVNDLDLRNRRPI